MDFERKLPTEQQDIADIVAGILAVQTRFAGRQKRPLGRGTHTKGVCVRATFEVFDLAKTIDDATLARRLARGLFAKPGVYPATARFANAASTFRPTRTRTCALCRSPCRSLPASSTRNRCVSIFR